MGRPADDRAKQAYVRGTTLQKQIMFPSLTVKFIKTPLKALFYLGFSAVPFRFTI